VFFRNLDFNIENIVEPLPISSVGDLYCNEDIDQESGNIYCIFCFK